MAIDRVSAVLLVVAVVAFIVQWFINRSKARRSSVKSAPPLPEYLVQTRALTAACLGNRATADRLIQHEKNRQAGITHAVAVDRALERLRVDRGRYR